MKDKEEDRYYIPTGTCYWCDVILPEPRVMLNMPHRRFCSDEHEELYKRRHPRRYEALRQQ